MDFRLLLWLPLVVLALLLLRMRAAKRSEQFPGLYPLFFLSGFPALIYQIVWERALFGIYGLNIQSVTIVVSGFMLGLGVGSLLGGYLSRLPKTNPVLLFGVLELATAAYGLLSLPLFHWVGLYTAGTTLLRTTLLSFSLIVVPTVLMGCTLPLLAGYVARISLNTGRSVGALYFVNTLGSAFAAFLAGDALMRALGQTGSVITAACVNVVVAGSVLLLGLGRAQRARQPQNENAGNGSGRAALSIPLAALIAGFAGFIALAYEIVWYRLVSFTSGGRATSFAFMLGSFLAGVAVGAAVAERFCSRMGPERSSDLLKLVAGCIAGGSVIAFFIPPMLARWVTMRFQYHAYTFSGFQLLPAFFSFAMVAGLLATAFPVVCHLAVVPDRDAGSGISLLYWSNILGCVGGSLIVGFLLMDWYSLRQVALILAALGLILSIAVLWMARPQSRQFASAIAAAACAVALLGISSSSLFTNVYNRLQWKGFYTPALPFKYLVENRSGIITVGQDDRIYGGGVYDGAFNTDLVHDRNGILRAYAISGFHPSPRNVLMIGLSSGSWAQVIANNPAVEKLTVVEINPGYLSLIARYPKIATLLSNPKVSIVIDDGRRWLHAHPEQKFDAIVMNTTFHWREHTSNLLSKDFLMLLQSHLNPGGVAYYNTTSSPSAFATGLKVFRYGLRVQNFLAVSDSPVAVDGGRWRNTLLDYRINGIPILDPKNPEDASFLLALMHEVNALQNGRRAVDESVMLEYGDSVRARVSGAQIITDDNMWDEW